MPAFNPDWIMSRYFLGTDVFSAAIDRMAELYRDPRNRILVGFSAGKDSNVALEICCLARDLERPGEKVEVCMRDEEIMYPGTYEYAERTAARDDIDFHWMIAGQPIINVFDRHHPYWWVFDRNIPQAELDRKGVTRSEDLWVRQPPEYAFWINDLDIVNMNRKERFPPPEGGRTIVVLGLRTSESGRRAMGLKASRGYLTTGPDASGVWRARPIYDFQTGDVWKAIADNHWDYNRAYDIMTKLGVPRDDQRIAPPTMTLAGLRTLWVAASSWPQWWDRVTRRVDGMRTAVQFGLRGVTPQRRYGETWKDTFERECVREAPEWISERADKVARYLQAKHQRHSAQPLPDVHTCHDCYHPLASWQKLARNLYGGDPFSMKSGDKVIPYVDPDFFRPGSGHWAAKPTFG